MPLVNMNYLSFRVLSFFAVAFFLIAACSGEKVNPAANDPLLSVDSASLNFPAKGGGTIVTVTMNGKSWSAESDQAWCVLSSTSSSAKTTKVTVLATENTTTVARSATVTFVMDTKTVKINVSQKAGAEKSLYPTYASWISRNQTGMFSNSFDLAKKIMVGWNLGNSLEVPGDETGWGNPKTTKAFIDSVKKAGINAVRLPCSWNSHLEDASNAKINTSWFARVKEVVGYCVANDMYVIVNIHWDGGWLENNPTYAMQKTVNAKQKAFWEQIAMYFRDYDEHLLFAGTNEVHVEGNPTAENFEVQLSYNQTFVNAVRSTGGKNSYRNLIVQAYVTNIDYAVSNLIMAADSVQSRLLTEVHYYDPWDFCGLETDASWATTKSLWGKDFAQYGTISNWGQEDYLLGQFQKMKTNFVDKGYPVILGEFAATRRSNLTGDALVHHLASRAYFHQYVAQQSKNYGLVPFYWDNGVTGNFGCGLFDRNTGGIFDKQSMKGLLDGAAAGHYPY
jgi:endoglucanase